MKIVFQTKCFTVWPRHKTLLTNIIFNRLTTSQNIARQAFEICLQNKMFYRLATSQNIFLGDKRNISCLRNMQMTRETCCSLVTRLFSHPGRHAEYSVSRDMSPSLAIALQSGARK